MKRLAEIEEKIISLPVGYEPKLLQIIRRILEAVKKHEAFRRSHGAVVDLVDEELYKAAKEI